ncbi:MAG: 50S ribosomal protein L1, partial [Candidatus Saccharimonadales bacterium]
MAKKAELLTEAKKLKLEVSEKNTIAEIEAAIASVGTTAEPKAETKSTTAKSGKRSAKATAEVEEKIAKEERKQTTKETEAEAAERPKIIQKPARTTLERKSKKFQELAKLIEADKSYSLTEAI